MSTRVFRFGPFNLDLTEQVLLRNGESLPLKPKVFDVLAVLVQNSGRVVCKDELMKQVWADSYVEEGNLAVSIFEIRKALGNENGQRYIETVPRRGYRFVATVSDESEPTSPPQPGLLRGSADAQSYPVMTKGSIAVLPFKFIGGKVNEYLGLGMADALITRLSNLKKVTVRPTSAIRKYNGLQDSILAGRELGVEWVLDGSIRKSRYRIRLTVQLSSVTAGELLWAEKFDEKLRDIFAVEDSISEQVTMALAPKVTRQEKKALARRHTRSPEAYQTYLKGRFFLEKRTTQGCKKAIQYFEDAIAIDPNFALAFAGVAGCHVTLNTILPSKASITLAEDAALKALKLDPGLAEAHTSLGYIKLRQWNWQSAETSFKTAIELNPNYAVARATYAIYLAQVGRLGEATAEIMQARALDPLSLTVHSQVGSILYLARRYEDSLKHFRAALELDSAFPLAHFMLGYAFEALGEYEAAVKEYELSREGLGNVGEFTACVGRIWALSGEREQALSAIDRLRSLSATGYVQPTLLALVYAALADNDAAFENLERAYREHDEDLSLLKIDPRWDVLRDDPRFDSLLRRVGLGPGSNSN